MCRLDLAGDTKAECDLDQNRPIRGRLALQHIVDRQHQPLRGASARFVKGAGFLEQQGASLVENHLDLIVEFLERTRITQYDSTDVRKILKP